MHDRAARESEDIKDLLNDNQTAVTRNHFTILKQKVKSLIVYLWLCSVLLTIILASEVTFNAK